MWIENGDENQKSEMILLFGDSKTVFVFVLALFVVEFYTFENGQRKKKKKKKQAEIRKKSSNKMFFFRFYVCTPNFTKIGQ